MSQSRLLTPLRVGDMGLNHRIVLAPLTRSRATDDRVPTYWMQKYYGQRACASGTLLITETTFVSPSAAAGGWVKAPGIWRDDQVAAWQRVTDEVHKRGSFIFCQLSSMGRAADRRLMEPDDISIVGPSAIPFQAGAPIPRALEIEEIEQVILDFAAAAKNAIRAGFDGVEINAANGFLIDNFIQDVSNSRTDMYGGGIKNRSRILVNIVNSIATAIGPSRVGVRLSPWSTFQGMGMDDPVPQFENILRRLNQLQVAYVHMIEPRVSGGDDSNAMGTLDFALRQWKGPIILAGGYSGPLAKQRVDIELGNKNVLIAFGRHFIANPDLVYRLQHEGQLNRYDRDTFYIGDNGLGYTDYPFLSPMEQDH